MNTETMSPRTLQSMLVALCAVLTLAAGCSDDAGSQEQVDTSVSQDVVADTTITEQDSSGTIDIDEQDAAVQNDTEAQPDTTSGTPDVDDATTQDVAAQDVTTQDTAIQDTTVTTDTGTPDVAPTCGADGESCCTGSQCDTGLLCVLGTCDPAPTCTPSCALPAPGTPDAPVAVLPGGPPTLAGGTITDGSYGLTQVDIYADVAFTALVQNITITSSGDTYGSLDVSGTDWGLDTNFDLMLSMFVIAQQIDQAVVQGASTGGCFEVRNNLLVTDLTACGGVWPGGVAPPAALEFEASANEIKLILVLTREMLLASLPAEYQSVGGLAIDGNLPIVMTFALN